ncbi:FTR1 family protein [Deltaproteobacteria bacterium TL4]
MISHTDCFKKTDFHRFPSFITVLVATLLWAIFWVSPLPLKAQETYQEMAAQIKTLLNQALDDYRSGAIEEAKAKAQAAYFEIFENLEGPIRVNISAQKSYELERQFVAIRKQIIAQASVEQIEKAIHALTSELDHVVAEIQGDPPSTTQTMAADSSSNSASNWDKVQQQILQKLQQAFELYQTGSAEKAIALIQDTYFDVFEASGMETQLGSRNAELKEHLEKSFSLLVAQMKRGTPISELQSTLASMTTDLQQTVALLQQEQSSLGALFLYSLMIILREGLEAILIVTALIAYLLKMGHRTQLSVIYNACFVALGASVLTAILVKGVFKLSAASQEVWEGGAMLLASVVLFSVSYWLISKAEAKKWMNYLQGHLQQALSSGSLKALWLTAFLAVYREGAETVLFYEALASNTTAMGGMSVALGFIVGCMGLGLIYWGMRYGVLKLPIRPFFMVTGILLYFMAFVFVGQGIMELIEGKIIEPSHISWGMTVSFMGIYPYWQTTLPQLLLVMVALVGMKGVFKFLDFEQFAQYYS